MLPAQFIERCRGAVVSIDIDTTNQDLATVEVTALAIAVMCRDGAAENYACWVRTAREPEDEVTARHCAKGQDPQQLAEQLRAISRIARTFVADAPFMYAARFLALYPWRVAGPWCDVSARFREVCPTAMAPTLAARGRHLGFALWCEPPNAISQCRAEAILVAQMWHALDSMALPKAS